MSGHFDISWFIPALVKYKTLLRDVVVASFFIKLFALITPLFFQVMIDKVLVHKGVSTLDVLAVGLLVIAVFDVALNGLRNYVFSHTTNRVDVTLGAKLYHHLTHLPIAYFLSRQVGNTVARVRELDTIRSLTLTKYGWEMVSTKLLNPPWPKEAVAETTPLRLVQA